MFDNKICPDYRCSGAGIAVMIAGLIAATGGSIQAQPATLHVMIVADENDPTAGGNMKVNCERLVVFLNSSVESARLDIQRVNPRLLGRNGILGQVNVMPVNPDDTLFVYLASHSQRVNNDIRFTFSTRFAALTRSELLATMQARRPRLTVLITDTCNRPPDLRPQGAPSKVAPAPQAPIPLIPLIFNTPLVQSLFFDSRGVLNLVASAPGEVALCYPVMIGGDGDPHFFRGSIFTTSLERTLDQHAAERLSWDQILPQIEQATMQSFKGEFPGGFRGRGFVQASQTPTWYLPTPVLPDSIPNASWYHLFGAVARNQFVTLDGRPGPVYGPFLSLVVYPGTPAARGGLKTGDKVLRANGREVKTWWDLKTAALSTWPQVEIEVVDGLETELEDIDGDIRPIPPDKVRRLTIVMDGRANTPIVSRALGDNGGPNGLMLPLPVIAEPDAGRGKEGNVSPAPTPGLSPLGLTLRKGENDGVDVTGLVPNGPAFLAGIEVSDRIVELNGKAVDTEDRFRELIAAATGPVEVFLVKRDGSKWMVTVTLNPQRYVLGVGLKVENNGPGVPIVSVLADSAAEGNRLAVNDVILTVNGQVVNNYDQVQQTIARSSGVVKLRYREAATGVEQVKEIRLRPAGQ